jgi:hypothetical protein
MVDLTRITHEEVRVGSFEDVESEEVFGRRELACNGYLYVSEEVLRSEIEITPLPLRLNLYHKCGGLR